MPHTARHRLPGIARRGILVLLSSLLALGLGEALLRVFSRDAFYVWPPHLHQELHPSPDVMPGVSGTSRFEINSLGLRGDELSKARDLRILALGGSTTECLYLDQTEAWPHLLQGLLGPRAWVGNAGRSGLHTRHHRLQAEKLLDQLPRMEAVIVLTGVNDLSLRLSRDQAWRPVDFTDPKALPGLLQEAFAIRPPRFMDESFYKRTVLWQMVKRLGRTLRSGGATQDAPGRIYETWRRHRREAPRLRQQLPDLGPALAEYADNLRAIARSAARHHARIVFVTQPALWRDGLPPDLQRLLWMGGVGRFQKETGHEYYSVSALAAGMEAYNRTLLATCRQTPGAVCVDLAALLPRDTTVFYDDVHFNEAGSRKVARILAERLKV
ncbi:MAG TPA: GDSL-type esterase/lipase family protein [Thermoanaerobaculia bacterium]|jgi:lysophospholipase L1-like esterase|nr:GDSL-type esterase/lipase family protein [Thermoanaerobaculia bacterium]